MKSTKYPTESGRSAFWLRIQTGAFRSISFDRIGSIWRHLLNTEQKSVNYKFFQPKCEENSNDVTYNEIINVNYDVKYASKPVQTQT